MTRQSDPYVRVQLNNVTVGRTDVINNSEFFFPFIPMKAQEICADLNPEWDQIIYIPVHSLKEVLSTLTLRFKSLIVLYRS